MAEGYKDFVNGAVLGESDLDDYLMRQSVMRFADASARNTALSAILTEGLCAYLKDVDQLTMYNGSAWVILGAVGSQLSWTPFVSQNTNPTMTVSYSTYDRQGKQITGRFYVVVASGTGTAANEVRVTLPAAPADTSPNVIYGNAYVYDASATTKYRGFLVGGGVGFSTAKILTLHSTADGYLGTSDFTAALAAGDAIAVNFQYEAASASA